MARKFNPPFDPEVRTSGEVGRDGVGALNSRKAALAKRHVEERRLAQVANLAVDLGFQNETSCSVVSWIEGKLDCVCMVLRCCSMSFCMQ